MARCAHTRTQRLLLASLLLLPFVSALPGWTAHANGTTYYIGNTSDDYLMASNGCDLPNNTTCSLHGALTLAISGADTIMFGSNIPNAPIATTITLSQTITPTMSVILDGTGKQVILKGGTGRRPLLVPAVDANHQALTVTLIALTLTDGDVGSFPGGNVLNDGTLILNHTVVQNGTTTGVNGGGGISNTGTLLLTNGSVVAGNTAGGSGGGIANTSGASLTIINSTVSGNTANGSSGGGILNADGPVTITNSTISGNIVNASGLSSGSGGGGIYSGSASSAILTMTNATISDNTANNSASGGGGGMYLASGVATITSSTVSGNAITSDANGHIGYAGGIYTSSPLILKNSLVAGNTGHQGTTSVDFYKSTTVTFAYDLIGDGTGLPGIYTGDSYGDLVGIDPRFLSNPAIPEDFGGFTKTVALKPDSPAIDVVPNANCLVTNDQRGVSRPQPAGGMCDIGAFESRHYVVTATSGSPQSVIARHPATPIVVSVQDGNGVPVSGAIVTFVAPTSGASGTFTGNMTTATATTIIDGTATMPPFTTNGIIGSIAITATIENVRLAVALTNAAPTITLAPITLPPAISGTLYPLQTFTATGGTGPYLYAIASGLPPGLALGMNDGTHNGRLTGTPNVVGAFPLIVSATDTDGFVDQTSVALTVAPDITAVAPASGDVRGGSSVTISGAGFVAGNTSVKIGGTAVMIGSITPTQIVVIAPPGTAGTADIAVTVNGQTAVRAGIYRYGNVLSTPMAHATASATATNAIPRPLPPMRPVGTNGGNAMTPTPNPAPVRHQS